MYFRGNARYQMYEIYSILIKQKYSKKDLYCQIIFSKYYEEVHMYYKQQIQSILPDTDNYKGTWYIAHVVADDIR